MKKPFLALITVVATVTLISGCGSVGGNNTEPINTEIAKPDNITPPTLSVDPDTNTDIAELLEIVNTDDLAGLDNITWTVLTHYPSTKSFLLEGPAGAKQMEAMKELADTLKEKEWIEEEDTSTDSRIDMAFMSEHGYITLISNDTLTGVNLQYGNL